MKASSAALALAMLVSGGCAANPAPATPEARASGPCPAVDSLAGTWIATILIDGRAVARRQPARREQQEFPETFALLGPEPQALAALSAERIDLIQFARGPDPEKEYGLCPGEVAFLISTRDNR